MNHLGFGHAHFGRQCYLCKWGNDWYLGIKLHIGSSNCDISGPTLCSRLFPDLVAAQFLAEPVA